VKVLVVLEDPTLDQYIVKPIVEKPYMRGVKNVFDQIDGIVEDNPMVDLFLIVIDRDCDRENHTGKLRIRVERHEDTMVGCLAREEVEVWMLAAQNNLPASWGEIRRHCDPKEHFAERWLAANGFTSADVGHGRKRAMQALPTNFRRVLSRCDELRELSAELRARLP